MAAFTDRSSLWRDFGGESVVERARILGQKTSAPKADIRA
jgi:hypothetical protein